MPEHAAIQTDDNDREKETLMIGVQKLMLMRNKRSDKDRGAEEEYNNEDRSDNGGCAEEADNYDYDDDDKEERIDKTCSGKTEIDEEERSDNDQCAEEADDNYEKRDNIGRCVQAADDKEEQKKR